MFLEDQIDSVIDGFVDRVREHGIFRALDPFARIAGWFSMIVGFAALIAFPLALSYSNWSWEGRYRYAQGHGRAYDDPSILVPICVVIAGLAVLNGLALVVFCWWPRFEGNRIRSAILRFGTGLLMVFLGLSVASFALGAVD